MHTLLYLLCVSDRTTARGHQERSPEDSAAEQDSARGGQDEERPRQKRAKDAEGREAVGERVVTFTFPFIVRISASSLSNSV